ncbi:hypothetical protein SCHPADRAFT_887299 [Schizopora paradoxa]|uniref:DUF6534 domain-containing protein n=1 Tax=Schizopora paradoxa TaxID=27342 RepID=A0A0H2SIV9_9AGAM|nr:hypothetical protein SCHPADRAFT_887299 [Schizopora paradoxa]
MSSATALPALDNTMGALYIGVVLSMSLWGAGCVQMYYYYDSFPKDSIYLKLYVAGVWALDTVHQGLIIHSCYVFLITNYFNPLFLTNLQGTLKDMVIVTGFVCFCVQTFFIMRVWRLSHKNIIVTATLSVLCFVPFVLTIVYFAKMYSLNDFTQLNQIFPISKSINVLSAVADVSIAATLIFLLQRSRTGFKNSETIINKMIMFSVNTGLLTSLVAIASLLSITAWPLTFIYITFYFLVPRLYINSLYATLNARNALRSGTTGDTGTGSNSVSLGHLRGGRNLGVSGNAYGLDKSSGQIVSIKVTESMHDDMAKSELGLTPSESDVEVSYDRSLRK